MTKTKTDTKRTINSTTKLENLTGIMGKAAKLAADSLTCILIEITLKFEALEVTAANIAETLESDEWSGLNRAYNTGRMKAFAKKLVGKTMRKHMALISFESDKKGNSYQEIAGVYRVTDESTSKQVKYSARYTNGYNNAMHVVRYMVKNGKMTELFELLDSEKPDADAFRVYREAYQAEKTAARKAQAEAEAKGEGGEGTSAPELSEESPQGLRDVYAKADSVKRNAFAASEYMTDDAWTAVHEQLDAICKLFQDIIQAAPDEEEEAEAGKPDPEAEAAAVEKIVANS